MSNKIIPYSQVPAGAVFKALKPEVTKEFRRTVKNDGTYLKNDSAAVEIHSNKDAIFAPTMPCRIIKLGVAA